MRTRILVVDDEPQVHRFLRPALEVAGYEVDRASNGDEALRLAANRAPDLILLDLGLPDLDGQEVLARLRAFSRVPVIVLSARDRELDKIAALDGGADDYVEKPFAVGELLARIRSRPAARRRFQPHRRTHPIYQDWKSISRNIRPASKASSFRSVHANGTFWCCWRAMPAAS